MPRIVQTALGEKVDFDSIVIKQQLAQAPMNLEVANRKKFIDNQEAKKRGQRAIVPAPTIDTPVAAEPVVTAIDRTEKKK